MLGAGLEAVQRQRMCQRATSTTVGNEHDLDVGVGGVVRREGVEPWPPRTNLRGDEASLARRHDFEGVTGRPATRLLPRRIARSLATIRASQRHVMRCLRPLLSFQLVAPWDHQTGELKIASGPSTPVAGRPAATASSSTVRAPRACRASYARPRRRSVRPAPLGPRPRGPARLGGPDHFDDLLDARHEECPPFLISTWHPAEADDVTGPG